MSPKHVFRRRDGCEFLWKWANILLQIYLTQLVTHQTYLRWPTVETTSLRGVQNEALQYSPKSAKANSPVARAKPAGCAEKQMWCEASPGSPVCLGTPGEPYSAPLGKSLQQSCAGIVPNAWLGSRQCHWQPMCCCVTTQHLHFTLVNLISCFQSHKSLKSPHKPSRVLRACLKS